MIKFFCAILVVMAATSLVEASEEVRAVYVVHRHGARTPIVKFNQSEICGDLGCGMLTDEGKDMLVHAGKWLRETYPEVVGSDDYNSERSFSRSTQVKRTMQSAAALLRGAFPNMKDYYPSIQTFAKNDDSLMYTFSPVFHILVAMNDGLMINVPLAPTVLSKFTRETLATIGNELFIGDLCSSNLPGQITACALRAQDIAQSFLAAGTIDRFPVTKANLEPLNDIRRAWFEVLFTFNKNSTVDAARGSLGQNLAQYIMKGMESFSKNETGHFKLFEFSGHDTTLAPLAATLGLNELMRPEFGQMFAFELVHDSKRPAGSGWGVRAKYGAPGQTPEDHTYSMPFQSLRCINAAGEEYRTKNAADVCPLDDLWRFINSSKPTSAAGLCYLPAEDISMIECDGTGVPTNPLCVYYRQLCPTVACPPNTFLNSGDLSCAAGQWPSTTHVAPVAVLCTLGGLLIGVITAEGFDSESFKRWWAKRKGLDYESLDTTQ